MEQADKERNRLLLVKHTHTYTHTQHKTIQYNSLTDVGNGGSMQTRRETGYFWSNIHNYTRQLCKTHRLMLAMEQAGKKRNRLLCSIIHKQKPFSKNSLSVVGNGA